MLGEGGTADTLRTWLINWLTAPSPATTHNARGVIVEEAVATNPGNLAPLPPRGSITHELTARLLDYLTSGHLTPGSRLPSERQLAEALQVGRSAVRETLAALEVLGMVESRPGSGTYLRDNSSDLLPAVINWGLALGQSRTLDLFEARAELEVITARLAAERARPPDVERLQSRFDSMIKAKGSLNDFIDADVAFHLEVANIAGNTALNEILHSVSGLLRVWVGRAVKAEGDTASTLAEHGNVLAAVRAGDQVAAQSTMKTHMTLASVRLRRSLDGAHGN